MIEVKPVSYIEYRDSGSKLKMTLNEYLIERMSIKDQIIPKLKPDFILLENTLFESFKIQEYLIFRLNQIYNESNPLNGPKALIPMYYNRNCSYLWSSYILLTNNLNNPAIGVLRTVYETIQQMYFIILAEPTSTELLFKKNMLSLTREELKTVIKDFHWFKPEFMRNELYNVSTIEKQNELYKELSTYSHPAIKSMGMDDFIVLENIKNNTQILTAVCVSNIVALWENYTDTIFKESNNEFERVTDEILQQLGFIPLLIPDSEKYKKKVKVRPPGI